MACPYAKSIRGLVVYCAAINKKVSSLRYPCKGDYTRCPIYRRAIRAKARAEATRKPEKAEKPVVVVERAEAAPRAEQPVAPAGPATAAPVAAATENTASTGTGAGPVEAEETEGVVVGDGRAACDSLVVAELLISSQYIRAKNGSPKEIIEEVVVESREAENPLFFTGDIRGVGRLRGLAFKGRVTSLYLEKAGEKHCGGDAWSEIVSATGSRAVVRIYVVEPDKLPDNIARVIRSEMG